MRKLTVEEWCALNLQLDPAMTVSLDPVLRASDVHPVAVAAARARGRQLQAFFGKVGAFIANVEALPK